MALTHRRHDQALAAGLARWLAHRYGVGPVVVDQLRRPPSGYSSETVFAEASWPADGGRRQWSLVVRMPPSGIGTFDRYDLVAELEAQRAAAAAGVPVADPEVEDDPSWLGTPFMVMTRVAGHIIGALAHLDRWLTGQSAADQGRIYANFIATLCTIHRSDVSAAPHVPTRTTADDLDFWADYLEWSSDGDPVPTLVGALDWCRRHRPVRQPDPAVLWGDARFENMVVGVGLEPAAVLDWDMASIGAPEHDLAWFTSLDLTMFHLFGQRPAGFPDRAATVALFEEHSGREVEDLEWYETLAMVRSTAIMTRIGYLRQRAGEPLLLPIDDNPILDLVRSRTR
jgi:aminoglycoside phosphotransferase (APT) family kinase protein